MSATLEDVMDAGELYGAVKLKDGIFFGDHTAAHDIDFIIANKVSGIINCCGREVPNHFQSLGVEYLTYNWVDNESQIILDIRNIVVTEVMEFVDKCADLGESVLIHSYRGRSRCITLLTAYLIRKYNWSLNKALEFVQSRRGDVRIKPVFHRQLVSFERRLCMSGTVLSHGWDNAPRFSPNSDELILFNTYMNSRFGKSKRLVGMTAKRENELKTQRLEWRDHHTDDRSKLEQLSNSTGRIYLGEKAVNLRPILKKPEMYRKAESESVSAVTTAATTPEQSAYRPATPVRRGYEISSPGTRPPSIALNRANYFSASDSLVNRISSGLSSFGNTLSGPVRVGRTATPVSSPSMSTSNFPSRISNHYVRPPSPIVSHGRTAARPPSPAPSQRTQMRPPSPARIRPTSGGLSLNNEPRPTVPPPAVKSMVSASGYRRSQSPMVASLPGVRNHTWRSR